MSAVLSAVPSVSPNATGVLPGTIAAFTVNVAEVWFAQVNKLLPASFFLDVWMCSHSARSGSRHLGSFSSSCARSLSVLMMDSKAHWFSQWWSGFVLKNASAAAAVTCDGVQRRSRGNTSLNLCDPVFHLY